MTRIRNAVEGIWDFVVGDDWVTAAGVVAALGLTGLVNQGSTAWFVMPIAVALLLALSIRRESGKRNSG